MDEDQTAAAAATTGMKVVRDNTFHRAVADNAIVMALGRDYELGFIAFSLRPTASITSLDEKGEELSFGGVAINPEMVEVVRVRMSPEASRLLAFQILTRAIASGESSISEVTENLTQAQKVTIDEDGKIVDAK